MNVPLAFAMITPALAILYGLFLSRRILVLPAGDGKMIAIAKAIQEGAKAYLNRQYKTALLIGVVLFLILTFLPTLGWKVGVGFAIGAILSALAGYVGMNVSVRANTRTAEAAKTGMPEAMDVAIKGGAVTGLLVAGLALFGVAGYYALTHDFRALIGLCFGASLISLFGRFGGGIFTKAVEAGADMMVDKVGGHVGGTVMAADLFETYVATVVAAMLLGALFVKGSDAAITYPLMLCGVSIITSIVGVFFVRLTKGSTNVAGALYKGLIASGVLSAIAFYPVTARLMNGSGIPVWNLFGASLIGLIVISLLVLIANYFTSKKFGPVKAIAAASEAGHGANIIAGMSVSMKSAALPVFVIAAAMLTAFWLAGLYGVAIAAVSMLSLAGMVATINAFGPITENAAEIADMAGLDESVRRVTDPMRAVGDMIKAVTKGYAIAAAGLAAIVLFVLFVRQVADLGGQAAFTLEDPKLLAGLLIGGMLPYLFGSYALQAVGRITGRVAEEVRRQFREIAGIMEGTAKPDYAKCADVAAKGAIKETLLPALIPVLAPVIVGLCLGAAGLGGLLVGAIVTGLFVGISMTTGGAAWENAKKYIEGGFFGGKGSFAHAAAMTGDAVGDPSKDAAGPAINSLLKILGIVALLIVGLIAR